MLYSREEKIAHINKSPEAVGSHDKEKWLSIFSQDSIVEDPVGSKPHHNAQCSNAFKNSGETALSRFYDTFIAPNHIAFSVNQDIVCQDHVVRDLTINIEMGEASVSVPTHLLYELVDENGELKISRLAAHWELLPMIGVLLSKGIKALPVMASLSKRMMKYQGLSGAMGFVSGVNLLGARRKERAQRFITAFNQQDPQQMLALFGDQASVCAPYGKPEITPSELLANLPGELSCSTLLVAGSTVTASIRYLPAGEESSKPGVIIFEFEPNSSALSRLTFYYE